MLAIVLCDANISLGRAPSAQPRLIDAERPTSVVSYVLPPQQYALEAASTEAPSGTPPPPAMRNNLSYSALARAPNTNLRVGSGAKNGLPSVLVINEGLVTFPYRRRFPWQLTVVIKAVLLAENGMPTRDESRVLDSMGDKLDLSLTLNGNAVFLARITWNGTRQLLYRVNEPELADSLLRTLVKQPINEREWKFEMVRDADWKIADNVLSMLSSSTRK